MCLVVLLSVVGCKKPQEAYLFTSFNEPATEGLRLLYSVDGYSWTDLDTIFLKPEVGNQKVLRDPSMVQGKDGVFHLVWTTSWRGDLGFGYSSSKDLRHWTKQQFIPVMESFDSTTVNVWAPELFYDKGENQYVIVWSSTVPFKFTKGQEDELNNHRLYYTTTKDFTTFTPTQLFFDPGYSVIDATILRRGKKDYVLVYKDNTRPNRNLRVALGKSAVGPFTQVGDSITQFGFCEGPSVIKIEKDYLIYFDAYQRKYYGAIKTTDFKTFTDVTSEVQLPEGHKHGTILKIKPEILDSFLQW